MAKTYGRITSTDRPIIADPEMEYAFTFVSVESIALRRGQVVTSCRTCGAVRRFDKGAKIVHADAHMPGCKDPDVMCTDPAPEAFDGPETL